MRNVAILAEKALSQLAGKSVLVEGRNDVRALLRLGIPAITAQGSPWRFVEKHAQTLEKEVVLLFDFDQEGIRKTQAFQEALFSVGIATRRDVRMRVQRVFGVKTIEELPTRFEELIQQGETNGKNLRGYGQVLNQSQLRSGRNRRKTRHRGRDLRTD